MLARLNSSTLAGIDAIAIDVEVDVASSQLPGYHVVGMAAPSVREGAVRIRSALEAVGHGLPQKKITVNLAPADIPKPGTGFDLPIAIGILAAEGLLDPSAIDGFMLLGELGLDGALRKVRGGLAAAMLARQLGLRGIVLPAASANEAAVVEGIEVLAPSHLAEVVAALGGASPLPRARRSPHRGVSDAGLDLADVRGQQLARAAIEVAVAGGHNAMLVGPPGIGKSMLARRIPTILPPMAHDEALEVTKIYSALGLCDGLVRDRPFRAPHHTISSAALLGGGSAPRPGELSLAHLGVLFLDELPEFQRHALEALRQPLEDRTIVIGRAHGTIALPASVLLIAAANPCPCGWAGSRVRECTCTGGAITRYRNRLSGPLLDRIDLHVPVRAVSIADMRRAEPGESSAAVRERIIVARERQARRLQSYGVRTNAEMHTAAMRTTCKLDAASETFLSDLSRVRCGMSGRAVDRIIRVARTIADLVGDDDIEKIHLAEAAGYRCLDQEALIDARDIPVIPAPAPLSR